MKPFISVVSGTYNRLGMLQRMMQSARDSIGVGVPYEFVIVDGGSTDGTLAWLKTQPDVRLIEHGALLGAVKAFNDGAYAAEGDYVILANDDVSFVGDTITAALSFMQDHPEIGMACFHHNRDGLGWHVEGMPAIYKGQQVSVPYGQICMVPKYLGDQVGWWGDYLRTYGGDNELTCKIYELGYKVCAAPCTWVNDYTPDDDLRKLNNQQDVHSGQHPDTKAWVSKWTQPDGKVGPVLNVTDHLTTLDEIEQRVRVFYMPIYEPGHAIQKSTKHGLRDALAKRSLVYEFDYMNSNDDLLGKACAFDAKLFLMQLQDASKISVAQLQALRNQHTKALFVNWNGDYHPDTLYSHEYILLSRQFDLVGLVCDTAVEHYKHNGINAIYWQIGYEPTHTKPNENTPKHDVLWLANGYSQARLELASKLLNSRWNVGIYGSWPATVPTKGSNLYNFEQGSVLYQNAKVAISDSQWPTARGFVSNRLFQAMDAGVLLLQQRFDGCEELLGLCDGSHLVLWDTTDDLMDKIDYYCVHDRERQLISKTGQGFVHWQHSFDMRVNQLWEELGW